MAFNGAMSKGGPTGCFMEATFDPNSQMWLQTDGSYTQIRAMAAVRTSFLDEYDLSGTSIPAYAIGATGSSLLMIFVLIISASQLRGGSPIQIRK